MKLNYVLLIVPTVLAAVGGYVAFTQVGSTTPPTDGTSSGTLNYVGLAFTIGMPILITGFIFWIQHRQAANAKYLRDHGIAGTARLINFSHTNVRINKVPMLELQMDIRTQQGEQYQLKQTQAVRPEYYSLLRPGVSIPIMVDPKNRENLHLDLHALWQSQAGTVGTSAAAR